MSASAPHNGHRLGEKAIEAKGLVKRFKTGRAYVEVLKSVDFDACHGDVTMVMGPSGSGKSTLIAALSGLLKPDEGTVRALEADDLWRLSNGRIDRFRLDHCGFIFQGFNLFPALTARQQVMTALHYQGASKAEAHARALAKNPNLIFADEPTSALDGENGQVVIRPMMYVAMSYDHRIIDGSESVIFLVKVKQAIEDPRRLLLGL